jgi:glycosyltransferase involved in cell wall biosynthesis
VHHATYGSLQLGTALWRLGKPLVFGPAGGGQAAPRQLRRYFEGGWSTELARSGASRLLARLSPDFQRTMQRADLVLAVNDDTRRLAQRHGARDIRLMPDTGLGDDFFPAEPPVHRVGRTLRLLWLGRVIPRKGLALALDALGTIGGRASFSLTIIGDGAFAKRIPEWVSRNGLQSRVDWRGAVPWDEVRSALVTHDVLFFPTLRDSCPSQFFEAMALGLPVICLDIHGARDFVPEDAGIKVAPRDSATETAAALGDAVVEMARSPVRYQRMSEAAAMHARSHRWSVRIEQMNRMYREIYRGV